MTDIPAKSLASPFTYAWLLAVLIVAAYLRLYGATGFYYNPDETMHLRIAEGRTLAEVWQFSRFEAHPPLGNFFYHFWIQFSEDPAFARTLPLIFGLALIPLYYLIGRSVNGELTGIACAALIAFSPGCIIQSYVVRNYAMLMFFSSAAFYCYLRWRDAPKPPLLFWYAFWQAMAAATHFSAVFPLFCITAAHTFTLWRSKAPLRAYLPWTAANVIPALFAVILYLLWMPILVPLKGYFATHIEGGAFVFLVHALFYPLATAGYVLGYTAGIIFILCQVAAAITAPRPTQARQGLRFFLALSAGAYALGIMLVLTRLYPEPGTRHSLWILPFIVVPAGWMLANVCQWLGARLSLPQSLRLQAPALLLLAAGFLTYDPEARFADTSEYVWRKQPWDSFTRYTQTLGKNDLVITEKDDGIMLANLYPFMGEDAFSGAHMAALAPYGQTQILFNPYYPRNYSTPIFLATLQEAQARHMFDSIDRLVFLRMLWSKSPLTDLMLCDALPKQIVTFPAFALPVRTRYDIERARAALMIVPKDLFLKDVMTENGKARSCLDGKHDMVPGLRPKKSF
jgi:hypothetical protein